MEKEPQEKANDGKVIDHPNFKQLKSQSEAARYQRKKNRSLNDKSELSKFQDNDDFDSEEEDNDSGEDREEKFMKKMEKNEEDLKMKKLHQQIDYFGYEIEPMNLRNEREQGRIDRNGLLQTDKSYVTDPWLDSLEEQKEKDKEILLKKRNIQSVFSDDDYDSDDEDKPKKKQEKEEGGNTNMFLNAPMFMLKQKLTMLLDEKYSPSQMMTKLQKIFQAEKFIKKPVFKKNIRKKDKEILEKEYEEALKNLPSEQEKKTAQGQHDIIVNITDAILQKSGSSDIYTQTKEQIQEKLQSQMTGDKSSSSEDEQGSLTDEEEAGSDSDGEGKGKELKEGEKKVRFAVPQSKKSQKKEVRKTEDKNDVIIAEEDEQGNEIIQEVGKDLEDDEDEYQVD